MKHSYVLVGVCLLGAATIAAQTAAQLDSINQSLSSVQQLAQSTSTLVNTAVKPPSWQTQAASGLDGIIAAANAAKQTLSQVAVTPGAGRVINVPAGSSLQSAINAAVPGDTLVLQAGATYTGMVTLPARQGSEPITITSSSAASLSAGVRVNPSKAPYMARIVGPNGAAVVFEMRARNYRLIGLEITGASGSYAAADIVAVGSGATTNAADLPSDIVLDRLWIHGDSTYGAKRGVSMNGVRVTVSNSYISSIKGTWQETQALCAWNTPGPLQVENNYLEASGISILIGGAEPAIPGVTPSDVVVTGNRFFKPAQWIGTGLMMKHHLELKTGRRVTIKGNLFEQNYGQPFINLKVGTENINTPAITSDVTIENNIFRKAQAGIWVSGRNSTGGKLSNITVRNNLFDEMTAEWGGPWTLFLVQDGVQGITIENNTTGPTAYSFFLLGYLTPSTGLTVRNNVVSYGSYGLFGSGVGSGLSALAQYFPGAVVTNNVLYGTSGNLSAAYPVPNYFPVTVGETGFVDVANRNYRLAPGSKFYSVGTAGQTPGVDFDKLINATVRSLAGE